MTQRRSGSHILVRNAVGDLFANDPDGRRSFYTQPHARAVACEYHNADAPIDEYGIARLPAEDQHAIPG